jgi:hypothetical protein
MQTPSTKPKAWIWLAVLMPVAAIGTVALLLGLGLVFNASGRSEPLSEQERALLLDIDHLARWMDGYLPDAGGGSAVKTRFLDDSYGIEYVYDVPGEDDAPYLVYSITFEGSESEATATYLSRLGGTEIGFFVGEGNTDVKESNELFRWGDQSTFALLMAQGRPSGNVFVARSGTRVVYLMIAGLYFDDAQSIEQLLLPYLDELLVPVVLLPLGEGGPQREFI